MNSKLFVQKYQLYLPDREELRRELELTLREALEKDEEVLTDTAWSARS